MYVGHAGLALAAKGARVRLPLLLLLMAAFCVDLFEISARLVGLGRWVPRPIESLPVAVGLALLFAAVTWSGWRDATGAALVGLLALSHAAGDFVTAKIPLTVGAAGRGLELFSRPRLDFLLEMALVVGGWLLYRRTLDERSRGSAADWAIPVVLLACQLVFYELT